MPYKDFPAGTSFKHNLLPFHAATPSARVTVRATNSH